MNKWDTSEKAIEELKTGTIEVLDNRETSEYKEILLKAKTKDNALEMMKKAGYSEFVMGVHLGILIVSEARLKEKKGFLDRFRKK